MLNRSVKFLLEGPKGFKIGIVFGVFGAFFQESVSVTVVVADIFISVGTKIKVELRSDS